jgi:hypothetical protein
VRPLLIAFAVTSLAAGLLLSGAALQRYAFDAQVRRVETCREAQVSVVKVAISDVMEQIPKRACRCSKAPAFHGGKL